MPLKVKISVAVLLLSANSIVLSADSEMSKPKQITTSDFNSVVFYPSRNAPAKTTALNISLIPSQINAVLNNLQVRVGDKIEKNAVIAELDCRATSQEHTANKAQQNQLKAKLAFDERQLTRGKELAKNNNIGEVDLDGLKTNHLVSKAQLVAQKAMTESTALRVEFCQITAPFTGYISKRMANEGEMLSIGQPVVELIDVENLEVSSQIPMNDISSFESAASYYFESQKTQYSLDKRVLLPVVQNETRSQEARLNFSNKMAVTGSTGRLFWTSPQAHLPAHLLEKRDDQYGVFVASGTKAQFIVVPGAQEGRPIPLTNLTQWQSRKLVIDGRHGLINGQNIVNN